MRQRIVLSLNMLSWGLAKRLRTRTKDSGHASAEPSTPKQMHKSKRPTKHKELEDRARYSPTGKCTMVTTSRTRKRHESKTDTADISLRRSRRGTPTGEKDVLLLCATCPISPRFTSVSCNTNYHIIIFPFFSTAHKDACICISSLEVVFMCMCSGLWFIGLFFQQRVWRWQGASWDYPWYSFIINAGGIAWII